MLTALILLAVSAQPTPAPVPTTSVERLAVTVVEQLAAKKPEPPIGLVVEANAAGLGHALASAVAAELARKNLPSVVLSGPASAAEKTARDRDLRTVVRLTAGIEGGKLVAKGDALGTWVNFWAGQAQTRPPFSATLFAQLEADSAALALGNQSGAVSNGPLKLSLTALAHLPARVSALAVGDLDGDKKAEILALTDDELWVFTADGKVLTRYDLRTVPVAARQCREPFGALSVTNAKVGWLSSHRAHGEQLTFSAGALHSAGAADSVVLDGLSVKLAPGLNVFASDATGWQGRASGLPASVQGFSARDGLTAAVLDGAAVSLGRGGPGNTVSKGAGSATVLADLDGDQVAELVTTGRGWSPEPDEVRVLAGRDLDGLIGKSGSLSEVTPAWSSPIAHGRALVAATGDLEGDGSDEVVLAVWMADDSTELQLLKRVP